MGPWLQQLPLRWAAGSLIESAGETYVTGAHFRVKGWGVHQTFLSKNRYSPAEICLPSSVHSLLSHPNHHEGSALSGERCPVWRGIWKTRLERREWLLVFYAESHDRTDCRLILKQPGDIRQVLAVQRSSSQMSSLSQPGSRFSSAQGFCHKSTTQEIAGRRLISWRGQERYRGYTSPCMDAVRLGSKKRKKPLQKAAPSLVPEATHMWVQRLNSLKASVKAQRVSIFSKSERNTLV